MGDGLEETILMQRENLKRMQEAGDRLSAEVARLREALAFYADRANYVARNPPGSGAHIWRDNGRRAQEALDG